MFYRGMPDSYVYEDGDDLYTVFWYEGEFYLTHKTPGDDDYYRVYPTRYFDTADETLGEMLKIGAYKDWKQIPMEYPDE